jgi:hypothetical protein
MSQVRPGAGQSGNQRPGGTPPRKPTPPRRPATKNTSAKPGAAKGRPPTAAAGKSGAARPGSKASARPNKPVTARPPSRFSPATMGFAAVGLVVVIVLVFVLVKVTGGSNTPKNTGAPQVTAAPPSLVDEVTGVPPSVVTAVGTGGSSVIPPQVYTGQPPLNSGGRPEVLFIGAEFCPYCAAERWAMVNAFSRFGTWSGLQETTSSPYDTPPAIATFTFHKATLTSQYVDFVPVEHETNDTTALGTRTILEPLTAKQQSLWSNYSSHFGQQTGYPFVDFGNKVFVIGPSYNPATILAGLNQPEIAAKLTNPNDPVTQAIVGTANYMTAAVCSLTHQQPASVCTAAGVVKAKTALKLS